jgi:hypothetical protein
MIFRGRTLIIAMLLSIGGTSGLSAQPPESLTSINARFLSLVDRVPPEALAEFFPIHGDITYRRFDRTDSGTVVRVVRLNFDEARQSLLDLEGVLREALTTQNRDQLIGLFAHQLIFRGRSWIRIRPNRFVPRGAGPCSEIFVEWGREGGRWVITEIGDETFTSDALPDWCC